MKKIKLVFWFCELLYIGVRLSVTCVYFFVEANKPAKMYNQVILSKHNRRTLKAIRRTIKSAGYRRELKMAALQRACAFLKSQKQKGQK